jgi:hypothetical protein
MSNFKFHKVKIIAHSSAIARRDSISLDGLELKGVVNWRLDSQLGHARLLTLELMIDLDGIVIEEEKPE